MVDYNEIVNALNNLKPYQQNATLKINVPNIVRSVPNYRTEQLINGSRNLAKGAGVLGASIPFYKNVAFPVANDIYNGIVKGDIDKSKTLQFFMDIAGIDKNGNKIINKEAQEINNAKGNTKDLNFDKGLVPMGDLDMAGESDLLSIHPKLNQTIKQQAQNIVNEPSVQQQKTSDAAIAPTQINDIISEYINQLRGTREPYTKALENYLSNYNDLYNKYNMYTRRMRDLSAITGDPVWYNSSSAYNPINAEANKLSIIKQIQDARLGDIDAINELQGNMALAKEMELPPEAAFANKNLLTALSQAKRYATDLEKARIVDAMRRYGYDRAYDRALAQQQLRNLGMENVANINAQAYGYGGMAPGVGLTQQGTAQIQQPKAGTLADDFNKTK